MDSLVPLLILALVIFGAWKLVSAKNSPAPAAVTKRRSSESIPEADSQEYHWEGKGDFEFEVVGESHYQAVLESLAG